MYVNNLRERYYRIYKTIYDKAQNQIILDNSRVSPYRFDEIIEGDHVYYYLARSLPNVSSKIGVKWIGPLVVVNRFSESLYKVKPVGDWCKNPRSFCTVVNKLRKVDKDIYYEGLPDKLKAKITLPSLLKNFHDTDEDNLFFDETEQKAPFQFHPFRPYNSRRDELGNEEPALPSSGEERRDGEVDTNSPPPPLSPSPADNSRENHLERDDNISVEENGSTADDVGTESPTIAEDNFPRRTTRSTVFRGRYNDGFQRRGHKKTRYP